MTTQELINKLTNRWEYLKEQTESLPVNKEDWDAGFNFATSEEQNFINELISELKK